MAGLTDSSCNQACAGQLGTSPAPDLSTLGKTLDYRIQCCRQELERICVLKAKAEAMQMLDYPTEFIRQVAW